MNGYFLVYFSNPIRGRATTCFKKQMATEQIHSVFLNKYFILFVLYIFSIFFVCLVSFVVFVLLHGAHHIPHHILFIS